jgi:hypothetical protein
MLDKCHAIALTALACALATPAAASAQAPAGRYVLGSDHDIYGGPGVATVYDTKTKLTWQRNVSTQVTINGQAPDLSLCTDLTFNTTVVGWRLPTLRELFTLLDFAGQEWPNPLIDPQAFPNAPPGPYLSGTTSPLNPAQCAYFSNNFFVGCGTSAYVRCVR